MKRFREILEGPAGKWIAAVIAIVGIGCLAYMFFGPGTDAEQMSRDHTFVDIETGKPFEHWLKDGDTFPLMAPSGKATGYPAEACYWTKDGGIRKDPYFVVTQQELGKTGPTFCPDCGRLVIPHNPLAIAGAKPPPTESEYHARGW